MDLTQESLTKREKIEIRSHEKFKQAPRIDQVEKALMDRERDR
jgi:hypothetical protein